MKKKEILKELNPNYIDNEDLTLEDLAGGGGGAAAG